ncbi:MAG: HNH endonuclease [Prosthecobacter sp.]|uniref:HNH endonuclease n=1 Tax=Prosthecobacter sp. TaxID=1965333 RepID=UPI0025F899AE|nr:HNH endonuclease [Prosthecobacter sp.]MCF7786817.1 HNH endonuclease [Prosthecobacter sp.]
MKEPTGVVALIIDLLRKHPEGLTSGEIREKLQIPADQQTHLDRRKRDIRKWYELITVPNGANPRYKLGAKRQDDPNASELNGRVKAEVLHASRGRCQMCGKTIDEDGVKLQVDHKIPQSWGGSNERENLWALCVECNHGKKNLFASQDEHIKTVMAFTSVHVRIGELLKLNFRKPVSSRLIDFVANQDDWKKRTRELRYLGWEISTSREKQSNGRHISFYQLNKFTAWPEDPTRWIRQYEKDREVKNKADEADE